MTDVNDNAPRFVTQMPAATTISSRSVQGEIIFQLNATDADLGAGGAVHLGLEDGYGLFDINSAGAVYLIRNVTIDAPFQAVDVDPLEQQYFTLTIVATDGDGLSSSAQLMVEILPAEIFLAQTDPAVLSGALAGLCLVFLVLLAIVVVKCCINKKRATYECRKAESNAEQDPMGSKQSLSGWTVEISGSECGNLKTGLIVEPTESESTCLIKGFTAGSQSRDKGDETARDSGRGESEKESINSGADQGGVNCTKECAYLGHSDACWMPHVTNSTHVTRSSRDEAKFEIETLNSYMIGYSKQGFNRLSQTVLDKQKNTSGHVNSTSGHVSYQLPVSESTSEPNPELAGNGSSGYESSDAGNKTSLGAINTNLYKKRTVHYL